MPHRADVVAVCLGSAVAIASMLGNALGRLRFWHSNTAG